MRSKRPAHKLFMCCMIHAAESPCRIDVKRNSLHFFLPRYIGIDCYRIMANRGVYRYYIEYTYILWVMYLFHIYLRLYLFR